MSTDFVVPTKEAIKTLLAMIFGDGLGVSDAETPELGDGHTATFIDDDDKLVAACVCDKSFVAYSGAALSMIPADVANEVINGGAVSEAMTGNFYEVMNICSKLLMSDSSAHLRLDKTLEPGASGDEIATLAGGAQTKSFGVEIPRYGTGTLTFVVT